MRPIELRLFNVCQHAHTVMNFQTGITGVVGPNGLGKSNLITIALYFAITGRTAEGFTKAELLKWGTSSGRTEFDFEHSGVEYTLTRNVVSSSVILESEGEETLKNAAANEMMLAILGRSFDVFYETCWTPQGNLANILLATHANRMSFFQRLVDTRRAEVIRGMLNDKLNELPNFPDRTEDIGLIEVSIAQCEQVLANDQVKAAELNTRYSQQQSLLADNQAYLALPTETSHAQALAQATAAQTAAEQALVTFQSTNALEAVPECSGPSPEMVHAKQLTEWAAQQQVLVEQKSQALSLLTAPVVPDGIDNLPELRAYEQVTREALQASEGQWKLATNKECPTCRRAFEFEGGEEAREAVIAEHSRLTAQHTSEVNSISSLTVLESQYNQAVAVVNGQRSQLETQISEIDALLASTEVPAFDAGEYQELVTGYSEYTKYLSAKQRVETQVQQLERAVTAAVDGVAKAAATPYSSEEGRAQAAAFKASCDQLSQERDLVLASISGAKATVLEKNTQLEMFRREQQKRTETQQVRTLFERAREVLHRDNLPKLAMQKMLVGLNTLIHNYMSLFDTTFTAHINENFDFICSFPDNSEASARALSGGQAAALAISFRFAMSDLISSAISLIVMDEPTYGFDKNNLPKLADVFNKARDITEKGVYVLVSTHEEELYPSFSRLFNVEEAIQ